MSTPRLQWTPTTADLRCDLSLPPNAVGFKSFVCLRLARTALRASSWFLMVQDWLIRRAMPWADTIVITESQTPELLKAFATEVPVETHLDFGRVPRHVMKFNRGVSVSETKGDGQYGCFCRGCGTLYGFSDQYHEGHCRRCRPQDWTANARPI